MNKNLTRRQFLRSAGGVTFLALVPAGRGLFAAEPGLRATRAPVFTALPYIQPGPDGCLRDGEETVRLAWQTEHVPADFEVHYDADKNYAKMAEIVRTERINEGRASNTFNYVSLCTELQLGRRYFYRVRCNGEKLAEGFFTTRQPRGGHVRFVAFGDNSYGDAGERAIAFHAYNAHPDFVMNTGDNVYEGGLDSEYARFFFPVYNSDTADPAIGGPLLRSIPFYTVIANHDVANKDGRGNPVADFDAASDSLAYYTNFHLPLNGPFPARPTSVRGESARLDAFRACAGERFPQMANYSFDCGCAHFLCLDSNLYIDPTDCGLQDWIRHELRSTDAVWKFVVYHHPAFNVGVEHYREQHMRVLSPIFEEYGVDVVLSGHEHSYQRTKPMRFAPRDTARASLVNNNDRRVPGDFKVDTRFDGREMTTPEGILYITTGAGGKSLYDFGRTNNPPKWTWPDDFHTAYVQSFCSDRHSFTLFDLDPKVLVMRQIDEFGKEIDRLQITKS